MIAGKRNKIQDKATKIALESVFQKNNIDFILYGGAIRGGKTFWALKVAMYLCEIFPGSRWGVIRKTLQVIRENTIPSFNKILEEHTPDNSKGEIKNSHELNYTHPNGSKILFRGENIDRDPELNRFRGFEVNGFILEEVNEITDKTYWKCFERAGSWIIPGIEKQPKPVILATCNPTYGWVKELIYDPWKKNELRDNWLYIPAKITDNPFLPENYVKNLKNLPKYEYEVYVNGNWDIQLKTGGEFLKQFELSKHVANESYNPEKTIHLSIDNNVLPYISVQVWQIEKDDLGDYSAIQIKEFPVEDPNNTARKSGKVVLKWLQEIGYHNTVFMYGDPTTRARNTISDEKKSFLDLFVEPFEKAGFDIEHRFFNRAPIVADSGEFVNAVFEGVVPDVSIMIDESCKKSISDYIDTKQDIDGSMVKKRVKNTSTGVSYEENGHFTDCLRYFICKAFESQFKKFSRRLIDYSQFIDESENDFLSAF